MQARFGNTQRDRNVGIAERIEASGLHQALGNIQYLLRGVSGVGFLVHVILSEVSGNKAYYIYLLVDKLPINR